jgi:hypothetical protein
MNPSRELKTERFSRTEGKTPAFVALVPVPRKPGTESLGIESRSRMRGSASTSAAGGAPYPKLTLTLTEKVWDTRMDSEEIHSLAQEETRLRFGRNHTLIEKRINGKQP